MRISDWSSDVCSSDLRIYRQRRRKVLELNSLMSAAAILALLAAAALFLVLAGSGLLGAQIGPLVYLIVFGWLSMLGLGQLYKIVAFMTWLECYGPSLGQIGRATCRERGCQNV